MSEELFTFTAGPRDARVMIVGDVFTAEDSRVGKPFSGASGHELRQMLSLAKIDPASCFLTAIVPANPPGGDLTAFLHPAKDKASLYRGLNPTKPVLEGLQKVYAQVEAVKPALIIGCGNLPLWAFTDKAGATTVKGYKLPSGIGKWRGSQLYTTVNAISPRPFLPIYHPASILRSYPDRFPTVHDLTARAGRFLSGARGWDRQKKTTNYWNPTFYEAERILLSWIEEAKRGPLELCVDIETWRRRMLVCVGFADDKIELCIPFFYFDRTGKSIDVYTAEQEIRLCSLMRELLSSPSISIIGQNFIYDHQFLSRKLGIYTPVRFDTMLMHHLMWPGTPKGLDYLASLYTDHYIYWKDESNDWDGDEGHEQLWKYNCKDVRETYDIAQELKLQLTNLNFWDKYEFQLEQWIVAAEMMRRGVRRDTSRFNEVRQETLKVAGELEAWLLSVMPEDLRFTSTGGNWFDSPIFSAKIFYEILGLPPVLHKKTKRPTVNYEAFETLKKRAPWLTALFDHLESYRSVGVFNSHFLDINFNPSGRFCCNFNIGGTETFRWSSSANAFGEGTNLQNIPKGDN